MNCSSTVIRHLLSKTKWHLCHVVNCLSCSQESLHAHAFCWLFYQVCSGQYFMLCTSIEIWDWVVIANRMHILGDLGDSGSCRACTGAKNIFEGFPDLHGEQWPNELLVHLAPFVASLMVFGRHLQYTASMVSFQHTPPHLLWNYETPAYKWQAVFSRTLNLPILEHQ